MARAKKDQTEATPDTDVVQEAEAAAADAAVAVETEPAAEPQAPTTDAVAESAPVEFMVVKTRHNAPYRRCGRLFGAEETRIAVDELSEDDINRLNNDPHLLVHFETPKAE